LENIIQINLITILGITALILAGLWYFVPLITGLPWVPSKSKRIRRALELAGLKAGETIYDLGAGDGRVLTIAAGEFGAHANGIELSPVHCLIALGRIFAKGLQGKAKIRWGNLYRSNIRDADVIYVYLTRTHAFRVKSILDKQLRRGARVVTLSSDLEGWEPSDMDSEALIFLYEMPPVPGSMASFMERVGGLGDGANSSPIGKIEA
jgi:hypothetical protein